MFIWFKEFTSFRFRWKSKPSPITMQPYPVPEQKTIFQNRNWSKRQECFALAQNSECIIYILCIRPLKIIKSFWFFFSISSWMVFPVQWFPLFPLQCKYIEVIETFLWIEALMVKKLLKYGTTSSTPNQLTTNKHQVNKKLHSNRSNIISMKTDDDRKWVVYWI